MVLIRGYDSLESFSGEYSDDQAKSALIVALEQAPSRAEFDFLIEGVVDNQLLSGSQLLAQIS